MLLPITTDQRGVGGVAHPKGAASEQKVTAAAVDSVGALCGQAPFQGTAPGQRRISDSRRVRQDAQIQGGGVLCEGNYVKAMYQFGWDSKGKSSVEVVAGKGYGPGQGEEQGGGSG